MGMTLLTKTCEIPKDADPADYALYANLRVFVQLSRMPDFERRIAELEKKLSEYEPS